MMVISMQMHNCYMQCTVTLLRTYTHREIYNQLLSQQIQDPWAETDRIPISKRRNEVRIDSACIVLLQSRFAMQTHVFST